MYTFLNTSTLKKYIRKTKQITKLITIIMTLVNFVFSIKKSARIISNEEYQIDLIIDVRCADLVRITLILYKLLILKINTNATIVEIRNMLQCICIFS